MEVIELKRKAAEKALEFVESGMVLGLGTGSTVHFTLLRLAELLANGTLKNIVGIPTSINTQKKAEELGIPLSNLDNHPEIDLVIDGADEVSVRESEELDKENIRFDLIKGGGGALLREKIIAQAGKKFIAVVDESKLSNRLFEKYHLPIEVVKIALNSEKKFLNSMGGHPKLRLNSNLTPYITDEGNNIFDTEFQPGQNLEELNVILNERAGIIGHGLFLDIADIIVIGSAGNVKILSKKQVCGKIL